MSGSVRALAVIALWAAGAAPAAAQQDPGPFAAGRFSLSLGGGSGGIGDASYIVLGVGAGYYLVDGLEVGADVDYWFGDDPNVIKLSPNVRYVFWQVPTIKPYLGGFYRHWFITDGFDDLDSVGARGGVFYVGRGGGFALGLGAVYEVLLDCEGDDCTDIYPELALSLSF